METAAVLNVHNLHFWYHPAVSILKNVAFTVNAGEFVGIIGPNGGGKTTLLKLLLGFLRPCTGNIEIFGKSPKQARKEIAYIPQQLPMDRKFPISVIELVLTGRLHAAPLFGRYRQEDRDAAMEALEQVALADLSEYSLGSLSGGQLQRALIARALVSKPKLLLMDEPTASLDPDTTQDLYQLFRKLKGKMTMVMITHDLGHLIKEFDQILCVQKELTSLKAEEVCQHFAMGVYHPPLIDTSCGDC
ncbi:MAG: zinc ABC transporter ATP-binding protein [Waddliaceae bacterium]|nr:zinc ABC transporter ATP-binding protein [Waddliaceae bacterium]